MEHPTHTICSLQAGSDSSLGPSPWAHLLPPRDWPHLWAEPLCRTTLQKVTPWNPTPVWVSSGSGWFLQVLCEIPASLPRQHLRDTLAMETCVRVRLWVKPFIATASLQNWDFKLATIQEKTLLPDLKFYVPYLLWKFKLVHYQSHTLCLAFPLVESGREAFLASYYIIFSKESPK